jgi:hypothetical protein
MKYLFSVLSLGILLGFSPLVSAQQPADAAPADGDLAAQVQQLKAEVERLSRELERVSGELERLQNDEASRERPAIREEKPPAGKPAPTVARKTTPAPPAPSEPDEPAPLTVIVFQDGHRIECRNYAIVGQTLWVYTDQDSKKFPLSELNVEETRRANSDRGLAFQVPPSR